jgi:hypothetical protein
VRADAAKVVAAEQQRQSQAKIIARNEEYRAMLARKAINDKRKEARSIERQRAHEVRVRCEAADGSSVITNNRYSGKYWRND